MLFAIFQTTIFKTFDMLTFVEYFEKSIKKNWKLPALSNYHEEPLTYGQIGMMVKKMHRTFAECGITEGDKIVQIGRNNAYWAATYISIVSYGTVSVPLLQDFSISDVENTVNHSDAILMFVSDNIFKKLDVAKFPNIRGFISLDDFRILYTNDKQIESVFTDFMLNNIDVDSKSFSLKHFSHDTLASISYTSGTSGHSKGVMLTHGNYATNVEFGTEVLPFNIGDRVVSLLPLAHAYGMAFEFLTEFACGCHIILCKHLPRLNLD